MTWVRLDDQFHAHRKAKRAWRAHPRALGMHVLALSYCGGHLTDGLVDDEFVEEKLPNARERKQVTDALVGAGLWVREEDGWRINDWLDINPSRESVLEKRRRDAERKARRRHGDSGTNPEGVRADAAQRPSDPSRAGALPVPSRPVPSQAPPVPPEGGRQRERRRFERELKAWLDEHAPHPDDEPVGWSEVAGRLRQATGETNFDVWLEALHPHGELPDGRFALGAPADKVAWIEGRFRPLLEQLIGQPVVVIACKSEAVAA